MTKNVSSKKNRAPKKFSSELEIFLRYSFDVKICGLSIYDVFRVIRALLRGFKSSLPFYNRTNPVPERCVALVPVGVDHGFGHKVFKNLGARPNSKIWIFFLGRDIDLIPSREVVYVFKVYGKNTPIDLNSKTQK